jgi:hypothetical protein
MKDIPSRTEGISTRSRIGRGVEYLPLETKNCVGTGNPHAPQRREVRGLQRGFWFSGENTKISNKAY